MNLLKPQGPYGPGRRRTARIVSGVLAVTAAACVARGGASPAAASAAPETAYRRLRERMVAEQIRARDVRDPRVLEAMASVPRHRFVPETLLDLAYADRPLPIGLGQTISQPYIVALMTEALRPQPGDRVLEIGTGSGYQAAVLSVLVREVYTIEIVPELHAAARRRLEELGYRNVRSRLGDGYRGWPEAAPFDAIIVTAAPGHVPPALVEQLRTGGRLVIPVGEEYQELRRMEKTDRGVRETVLIPVRFVPMTGEAQDEKPGGNPLPAAPGDEDGEEHHSEG